MSLQAPADVHGKNVDEVKNAIVHYLERHLESAHTSKVRDFISHFIKNNLLVFPEYNDQNTIVENLLDETAHDGIISIEDGRCNLLKRRHQEVRIPESILDKGSNLSTGHQYRALVKQAIDL